MKFTANPADLLTCFSIASRGLGATTKPVLKGINFQYSDEKNSGDPEKVKSIKLTGSDGELRISSMCAAQISDTEEIQDDGYTLDPETLESALRACPGPVEFDIKRSGANLKSGRLNALIPVIDGEYPDAPKDERDEVYILTLNANKLGNAINRASTMAAPKPGRYNMNGVCVRKNTTGNLLCMSGDAYGHSSYVEPLTFGGTGADDEQIKHFESGLILPYSKASVIGKILSGIPESEAIQFSSLGLRYRIESSDLQIIGLCVEGLFPKVESMWKIGKMEEAPSILIQKKEWVQALQRLASFRVSNKDKEDHRVKLKIEGSDATISSTGKGSCAIPLSFTAEEGKTIDASVIMHSGQISRGLACFESEVLRFRYASALAIDCPDAEKEPQQIMSMPIKG